MSEVQGPENKPLDPRWITLRVSRINLGISLLGTLLAFPVLWLVSGLPPWVRLSLLAGFVVTMAADLWLILLKGRYSIGAFYLFDLDQPLAPTDTQSVVRNIWVNSPRLGLRVRFANAAKHPGAAECEGIVLPRAIRICPETTPRLIRTIGPATPAA